MHTPPLSLERNLSLIFSVAAQPSRYSQWGVRGRDILLFPGSVIKTKGTSSLVIQDAGADYLIEINTRSRPILTSYKGAPKAIYKHHGKVVSIFPLNPNLVYEIVNTDRTWAKAQVIGNQKPSFGWGNRTPFSTQVVFATATHQKNYKSFNRVTAQNSIRENQILERYLGFKVVMADAMLAKIKMGYHGITGSDADHLKSIDEIDDAIAARFTGYTLDPSVTLHTTRGVMSAKRHERTIFEIAKDPGLKKLFSEAAKRNRLGYGYVRRSTEVLKRKFPWISTGDAELDQQLILAVAIKFADCWTFMQHAYKRIRRKLGTDQFDFEASFDETAQPTPYLAHLLTANESLRKGVAITRVAVRYLGRFEKTTPWIPPPGKGLNAFQDNYSKHQRIADHFGYLQSIHSGSGKYNIYPYCKRAHLKTSGDISRPLIIGLAENNFPAFCHLYHDMIDSAVDTKRLYSTVSSHSNDFPLLHKKDPQKIGQKRVIALLENDLIWRTFSHYTYGMFKHASGTFGELLFKYRDRCAHYIAQVVNVHRSPIYAANGIRYNNKARAKMATQVVQTGELPKSTEC